MQNGPREGANQSLDASESHPEDRERRPSNLRRMSREGMRSPKPQIAVAADACLRPSPEDDKGGSGPHQVEDLTGLTRMLPGEAIYPSLLTDTHLAERGCRMKSLCPCSGRLPRWMARREPRPRRPTSGNRRLGARSPALRWPLGRGLGCRLQRATLRIIGPGRPGWATTQVYPAQ